MISDVQGVFLIDPLAFISYSISIIDPSFSSIDEVQ